MTNIDPLERLKELTNKSNIKGHQVDWLISEVESGRKRAIQAEHKASVLSHSKEEKNLSRDILFITIGAGLVIVFSFIISLF